MSQDQTDLSVRLENDFGRERVLYSKRYYFTTAVDRGNERTGVAYHQRQHSKNAIGMSMKKPVLSRIVCFQVILFILLLNKRKQVRLVGV